jgi:ligand-binding sensor domain-containing protein/signal transduction histidine kinase
MKVLHAAKEATTRWSAPARSLGLRILVIVLMMAGGSRVVAGISESTSSSLDAFGAVPTAVAPQSPTGLDDDGDLYSQPAQTGTSAATSPALPRPASGHHVKFDRVSLEQGLSQSSVLCILQDDIGFMWFGTEDGLNKYNGHSFTIYRHDPEDPNSLSNNVIRSIIQDREGVLWIGTDGGLNRLDRVSEEFTRYQNDPDDPHSLSDNAVLSIHEDQSGALWIGTGAGGLDRLDPETARFSSYQADPDNPRSLTSNGVSSIYEDQRGALWLGTDGGLDRFDRETESFGHYQFIYFQSDPHDPHSLTHYPVTSVCEDREGELWIGTYGGGLNRFDRKTEEFTRYSSDSNDPYSLSDDRVLAVYEDQAGNLWIGTYGGGLAKFDRETLRFIHYQADLNDSYSLSGNVVWSFYEDQSGALWIGTNDGLSKYDREREKFAHYRADPNDLNGLSNNHVLSIHEDRAGMLWIGTHGGGLNRFDRWDTEQFIHYQHNPNSPHSLSQGEVMSIQEDRAGDLWVGTWKGGLNRLDRESGWFLHYRYDPYDPHSLSSDDISAVYEDRSGVLWVGTWGGGLDRYDPEQDQFNHYHSIPDDPHSLSSYYISAIYEDRLGELWIGTYGGGLNRFDRETERFTRYLNNPADFRSLSDNAVWSIHEDHSGVLWIGTSGGLNRFDRATETFTRYREKAGLPNDVVHCILEDDRGNLWLSTNNGLSQFSLEEETFRNYDAGDGLQSKEFSEGACYKSSSDEMFFGGVNGLNAFYPDSIKSNTYVPPVVLTSLTQGGADVAARQAVETIREVTFQWPNNFFEFEFAALSYSQPEKNQYAYMLEELEEDWVYIGTRRFGRYTNLPGGTYVLRLKGSNNDGVWNEEGVSVVVTIVPPFWETWLFRGIAALVVLGGVAGGYRWRVRTIEEKNRELETLVEERTHALEERTREIERRRQELEALYRADAELHRHLRLDQVLQALVDIAVDILQADKSSLMVWDDQRKALVVRFARGYRPETLDEMSFAPGVGSAGRVAVSGEPVIVEDARTDPRIVKRATIIDPEGICSFMQVPITVGGEVFGVFSADYLEPRAFGVDEQRLFMALAQRAALAIDTAQLYEQTRELAVVEERNRLARDLHDAVTQTLFSASLISETLPDLWESDKTEGRQLLKELRQLSRGALAEMRTLLLELRPTVLVEARLSDLLRQLAEAVIGRTGIPVEVSVDKECEVPSDVHVALYRIAQEVLNNVVKHAHATQVAVGLRCTSPAQETSPPTTGGERSVELCISDNGRGFDPNCVPSDRLGLGIIRERAQAIGASLEIESEPGSGTRVSVVWGQDRWRQEREADSLSEHRLAGGPVTGRR